MDRIDVWMFGFVVGISMGMLIGGCTAEISTERKFKREAIEAGVAHYTIVDESNGKVEFEWVKK